MWGSPTTSPFWSVHDVSVVDTLHLYRDHLFFFWCRAYCSLPVLSGFSEDTCSTDKRKCRDRQKNCSRRKSKHSLLGRQKAWNSLPTRTDCSSGDDSQEGANPHSSAESHSRVLPPAVACCSSLQSHLWQRRKNRLAAKAALEPWSIFQRRTDTKGCRYTVYHVYLIWVLEIPEPIFCWITWKLPQEKPTTFHLGIPRHVWNRRAEPARSFRKPTSRWKRPGDLASARFGTHRFLYPCWS